MIAGELPDWLDPTPWLGTARSATVRDAARALDAAEPQEPELAAMIAPAADGILEELAARAQELTWQHFGRTISLYVPLYLSDYCSSGCAYCGFAADRLIPRRRLEPREIRDELAVIKRMGIQEVLLLTGERTPEADFEYVEAAVREAAQQFASVMVEAFPMTTEEYRRLAQAGCTGVTIYQETYDPGQYAQLHRWGPKRDYQARLRTPEKVLAAGLRVVGLGALLGLSDPLFDALCLYRHARHLLRSYWRGGVTISFPRVCPQRGDYVPPYPVTERTLARLIFAFRICLPDVPLVLSTRESARVRDGLAGVGINKMSVASRTTVGGYLAPCPSSAGQFQVSDERDVATFCAALQRRGLQPVFKSWDGVFR